MDINGQTALVTGANRGMGRHIAQLLRDRGATVYGGVRNPDSLDLEGVIPIHLDLTDPTSIEKAATATEDVSILVNNAGSATGASVMTGSMDDIRLELETHYFGTLQVIRAFADQLAQAGESYVVNMLALAAWLAKPQFGSYCVGKAAEWSMTNSVRQELAGQGTHVAALVVGFVDTDMTAGLPLPKVDPADVAAQVVDGIETNAVEIIADEPTRQVLASLSGGVAAMYPELATA